MVPELVNKKLGIPIPLYITVVPLITFQFLKSVGSVVRLEADESMMDNPYGEHA